MNKEELKNVIPHRNSMLLIDEATKTSERPVRERNISRVTSGFLTGISPEILLYPELYSVR